MNLNKLAASLVMLGAVTAFAQPADSRGGDNKGDNKPATGAAQTVETVRTANELVRYGDAAKDPLALITAARMLKGAGLQQAKEERVGPASTEKKDKAVATEVDAVLARAKALSAGRPDLIALADDVAKSGARGAVDGPARHIDVVGGRQTDQYRVTFRGGEPARVLVSGDGDSDLDLYVLDENGNQICKDDDATDDMVCGWTPKWTGQFMLRVVNRGSANRYVIIHN